MKRNQLIGALAAGDFDMTEGGILVPGGRMIGEYHTRKNDEAWALDHNAITLEYINYMMDAALNGGTPITAWFMTLFGVGQTPDTDWTAASFAALNTENTNTAEGYTSTTRPAWDSGAAANGAVDNSAAAVRFTFATASSVSIGGVALLSSDVRGGSSGVLASAANLNNSRTFEDGDTYDVVYRMRFEAA